LVLGTYGSLFAVKKRFNRSNKKCIFADELQQHLKL